LNWPEQNLGCYEHARAPHARARVRARNNPPALHSYSGGLLLLRFSVIIIYCALN
jgi:hypothetical protein